MSNGPVGSSIYHYTTLDALKSIVENRSIRLTDYRFLNDPQEVTYCMKYIKELLQTYDDSNPTIVNIKRMVFNLEQGLFDYSIMVKDARGNASFAKIQNVNGHIYILSLTHNNDQLAMWDRYGKDGCRLSLNDLKLFEHLAVRAVRKNHFMANAVQIINSPVIYNDNFNSIKSIIEFLAKTSPDDLNLPQNVLQLFLLHKDNAYQDENEFRIGISFPDFMLDSNVRKVFTVKNEVLKPQLELTNIPIEEILEDVLISPYNTSDRAIISVQEFLEFNLHKKIPVNKSQIKIRNI